MSTTDHLAKAKEYLAKGDDFYGKAADEIIAAQNDDPTLSFGEIGQRLGRSDQWVGRLVRARTTSTRASDEPLTVDWSSGSNKRDEVAQKVLRDPEQREQVIRSLSDDEREQIVDTAIRATAQEATAKAREHQAEPTLGDTGPIRDRTEYEIDVLLVKVWRWARELRRLVETRGVWVAEDRFDEALQRAQETENAVAEVRAAIEEAVNERSVA